MRIYFIIICLFISIFCHAQKTEKLTVYFKFNDYNLDFLHKSKLDSLMKSSNLLQIQIEAHCDSVGSNDYNDTLSLHRALEVKKYFMAKGIGDSIIEIKALGKRFPLNNNENEEEMALNRCADIFYITENTNPDKKITSLAIDTMVIDIDEFEVGSSFTLQNLNFKRASHQLLQGSYKTLFRLLNTLRKNKTLEIEIQGYVCCVYEDQDGFDNDSKTWYLSVHRAKVIYDYLITNGISASRLKYKGYGGKDKIMYDEKTENESASMRVEIKITKK